MLLKIPIKFNKCSDGFYCNLNKLRSLEGCPKEVGGKFNCDYNELTSLEYSPTKVSYEFNCSHNSLYNLVLSS